MAAKKIKDSAHDFKFFVIQGEKFMSIGDILTVWPYHRKTVERYIKEGRLESRKWGGKRLVSYASFLAFEATNG